MRTTKNKARCLAVMTLMMLSLVAGARAATVIDFNDGTDGVDIGAFYLSLGVTFTNGEWSNIGGAYVPHPDSDGLRLVGDGADLQPTVGSPITCLFSAPVAYVSVIANNVNANGARLELWDAVVGGNLIAFDQVVGASGATDSNFVLSGSGAGILRAVLYQPFAAETEGVLFDNLSFDPVPEPSALLMLGLGGLGCALRRKRS